MHDNDILKELWAVKDKLSKEASKDLVAYCAKINEAARRDGFKMQKSLPDNSKVSFAVAEDSVNYD